MYSADPRKYIPKYGTPLPIWLGAVCRLPSKAVALQLNREVVPPGLAVAQTMALALSSRVASKESCCAPGMSTPPNRVIAVNTDVLDFQWIEKIEHLIQYVSMLKHIFGGEIPI